MRIAASIFGPCLGIALLACGSSSSNVTPIIRPELIAVSPDDFMGQVVCDGGPGTAQSYVATLFDVTPAADGKVPDPGFQLASSPATSCRQPVTFSFVVDSHRYRARVDAYDRKAIDLIPFAAGSRLQTDASGVRVDPLWQATCGGYPPSLAPTDAGADSGSAGAAGAADEPPGVISYSSLTQTPHDCGDGLAPPSEKGDGP